MFGPIQDNFYSYKMSELISDIRKDPYSIQYMSQPLELIICNIAINLDPNTIKFIPNKEMQKLAVNKDGLTIRHIKNPDEEIKLLSVFQNGLAIQFIPNPSYKIKLIAVNNNGLAIRYIQNPDFILRHNAIKQNGLSIEYINDPTEEELINAVLQNKEALYLIKNKTPKIIKAASQNAHNPILKYEPNNIKELEHKLKQLCKEKSATTMCCAHNIPNYCVSNCCSSGFGGNISSIGIGCGNVCSSWV